MEVRRGTNKDGQYVLVKYDPLEFAIAAEAVSQMRDTLKEAFTKNVNQFSDPQYTAMLLTTMRQMIKEMATDEQPAQSR